MNGYSFSRSISYDTSLNYNITCNSGNLSLPTFYDNGSVFYDTVSLDDVDSSTSLTGFAYNAGANPVSNVFHPGVTGGYPASTVTTEASTYRPE